MPAIISKLSGADTYHSIFSPPGCRHNPGASSRFNDLPVELATEIFRNVVKSLSDPLRACQAAFLLATVCRFWRFIAVGDPKIWSPIFFAPITGVGCSNGLERGLECLKRAGTCGIDVCVGDAEEGDVSAEFTEEEVIRLVNQLTLRLHLVESIQVQLKSPQVMHAFLDALNDAATQSSMKNLRALILRCSSDVLLLPDTNLRLSHIDLLEKTPSLMALTLDGVHFLWSPPLSPTSSFKSTFPCLESLYLKNLAIDRWPTIACFRRFLQPAASTLRRLVLDGAGPAYVLSYLRHSATAFSASIPLIVLHTSELRGFSSEYARYIFDLLDCPNLRNLIIHSIDLQDCENLLLALTGATPRLERLAIYNISPSDHLAALLGPMTRYFTDWFKSMPALRILTVGVGFLVAFQTLLDSEDLRFIRLVSRIDPGTR